LRVTDHLSPRILSLPMFAELEEQQLNFVARCIVDLTSARLALTH
jgi:dTDP-4-amino-4,6-dideoxygalactose transaminase